jgi:RNA polymerase sigma factor (TIGR02999 family)
MSMPKGDGPKAGTTFMGITGSGGRRGHAKLARHEKRTVPSMLDTSPRGNITALLAAWERGDRAAFDQAFALLYPELRGLARAQLRVSRPGGTLNPTGLLHELYLKLVGQSSLRVNDRQHFFALAVRVMRQVVVDLARRRVALKRGGAAKRLSVEGADLPLIEKAGEIVALDGALERLEALDPHLARVVEMRFFGGLSVEETAKALDISGRTVKRNWQVARAYLLNELHPEGSG